MATSETRALDLFRRWMRRITSIVEAPFSQTRDAKIFVGSIEFSGGQRLTLADNSILVIVGPNNAGKSSALRELRDYIEDGRPVGPVLSRAEFQVTGTVEKFRSQILAAGLPTDKADVIRIHTYEYRIDRIEHDLKQGFVGSKIIPFFISYLGAEERQRSPIPVIGEIMRIGPQRLPCSGSNWMSRRSNE